MPALARVEQQGTAKRIVFPRLRLEIAQDRTRESIRRRGHNTRPCPEFDAMHERYCGDSLNGVCAPRRGRMLACQVRRSATWVTRPWAFRGRFISRAMW